MTLVEALEVPLQMTSDSTINNDFLRKAEALRTKLHEWIDRPLYVVRFEPDASQFFKCKAVPNHTIKELSNISYRKGSHFILDFGSHRVGYLSFHLAVDGLNADAPTRLRLTFGEVPYDVTEDLYPSNSEISTSWLPDEIINVDWAPADVDLPRRYPFRYVKVEIIDTSPRYKVRFQNIRARATSAVSPKVFNSVEPLKSEEEDLAALDRISRITLRDCMHTVFEDGPRRDRRLWIGDLRLQALTNYCTFKDFDLVKRCLYLCASFQRKDSGLSACIFEHPRPAPGSDYIVDYSALFGPTVYDYAVASGDLETAEDLWPTVLGSMKFPLEHLDEKYQFNSDSSSAWKFLDWASDLDTSAGMHGVVLYSCKQINRLAALLEKPEPFSDIVIEMHKAASLFYCASANVFVSGPKNQISWASQAWLALAGVMDVEICRQAILNAMADPKAIKPLTPYCFHHVALALAECGGEEQCLKLIREYWGGMVRAGADTFWECFNAEESRRSPYGDWHNNSYCHAWSCTPSYLVRVVLDKYLSDL